MKNKDKVARTIVIDTREQRPYEYENSVHRKLETGDYSVERYEEVICVERKSIDDLVNTLINHKDRFKRELIRMIKIPHRCIVVECTMMQLLTGEYTSGVNSASVFGIILKIMVEYQVPVYFCDNRTAAKLFTEKFLLKSADRVDEIGEHF